VFHCNDISVLYRFRYIIYLRKWKGSRDLEHAAFRVLHHENSTVLVMHTFCHGQTVYQSEDSSFPRCKDRKLKNLQNGMIWG